MTENSAIRTTANPIKMNYKQNFFTSLEKLNSFEKNHWVWLDCNYFLKYSPDKKNISYLNLTPFHKIHNMMGSVQNSMAHPKIEILMEKSIIFDNSLGWNWHKSWILPMITVRLLNYQDYELEENKIFAKLFVVKAGLQETETFYLVDIGIKGENKIYLKNNVASFNNLKFASTSYNNEGLKFHLVVALFYEINNASDFSSTSNLRIIESKLSPPIYVDSRKSARDNLTTEIKMFDYFNPDLLVKPLMKRRKKEGEISEEMITNSFKGFINYYTAANIRNKVKHPFFPALRFSNSISLYFNKEYFKNMELEMIIEKLLMLLNKLNENIPMKDAKPKKGKNKIIINNINENAYLTIFIKNPKDTNFSKKVAEFLTSFDQRAINIVCNNNNQESISKFEEITDLGLLTSVYKSVYEKNATKSINQDDDEYDDEDEGSEKSFRTSSSNFFGQKSNNPVINSSSNPQKSDEIGRTKPATHIINEFTLGQSSTQISHPKTGQTQSSDSESKPSNTVKQENITPKIESQPPKPAGQLKLEEQTKNMKREDIANQEFLKNMGMQAFPNPFMQMMGRNDMGNGPMFPQMGSFPNYPNFMGQGNSFMFPSNASNPNNNMNAMGNPMNQMGNLPMNMGQMPLQMSRMFPGNSAGMMNFPQNAMNFYMGGQAAMGGSHSGIPLMNDAMNMNKNMMMHQQMQQLSNAMNNQMGNNAGNPGAGNNMNNGAQGNLLMNLSQVQARKAQLANDLMMFKNFL